MASFQGFRFTEIPRFPYIDDLWDGDRQLMKDGRWLEYEALPSGPCGWKYCGTEGCILAEDGQEPCNG